MAGPQQKALESLYDSFENLCARLERRKDGHNFHADSRADMTIQEVAKPVRDKLREYLGFHREHTDENGCIGQKDSAGLSCVALSAACVHKRLITLCDVDMPRILAAPESAMGLSPHFKKVMEGEHALLSDLRSRFEKVFRYDLALLEEMRNQASRPAPPRSAARLTLVP